MAFPVPGDAIEQQLDLNQQLIKNPAATFFMRADGHDTHHPDVHPGDLLIVDRSLPPQAGKLVVAVINGELVVTRVQIVEGQLLPAICPDEFPPELQFEMWGVVTTIIRAV